MAPWPPPLEAACWLARALDRRATRAPQTLNRESITRIGGGAWSGIAPVLRDPALRNTALWMVPVALAWAVPGRRLGLEPERARD